MCLRWTYRSRGPIGFNESMEEAVENQCNALGAMGVTAAPQKFVLPDDRLSTARPSKLLKASDGGVEAGKFHGEK